MEARVSLSRMVAVLACLCALSAAAEAAAAGPTKEECVAYNQEAHNLRREGRLTAARSRLLLSTGDTCPEPVREDSAQLMAEINKAQPSIVFGAKDAAGADVTAVRVSADGSVVAERLGGRSVMVDPGEHTFRFDTDGAPPVERTLLILEGEKERRELIVFASLHAAAPPPGPPSSTPPAAAPPPSGGQPAPRGLSAQAKAAIGVGALGVVSLVVAIATGVTAKSKWNEAQTQHCNAADVCDGQGIALDRSAGQLADASTAMFVVTGVAAAAAIALGVTAPRAVSVGMAPNRDGASLLLVGSF